MKCRLPRYIPAAVVACTVSTAATAQWLTITSENIPRTSDGKANLSAPAPRTADAKPDLSGIWQVHEEGGPPKYALDLAADLPGKEVPLQPWAAALVKERAAKLGADYPPTRCIPPGVPNLTMAPHPFKIVQTPGLVIILYEALTTYRQIFTEGRSLPQDPNPTWMGYSVGRWDGDTLLVRTSGFNDKTWIDIAGHPNTEALQVIERFRRRDFGHMDMEITIDDPKAYKREGPAAHATSRGFAVISIRFAHGHAGTRASDLATTPQGRTIRCRNAFAMTA